MIFFTKDEHRYRIGTYTFIEHLCHKDKDADGKFVVKCQYPEHFNMFSYDDSTNTLLFLGYYNSDPESVSTPLALNDFESFYQTHFSQYYALGH